MFWARIRLKTKTSRDERFEQHAISAGGCNKKSLCSVGSKQRTEALFKSASNFQIKHLSAAQ